MNGLLRTGLLARAAATPIAWVEASSTTHSMRPTFADKIKSVTIGCNQGLGKDQTKATMQLSVELLYSMTT